MFFFKDVVPYKNSEKYELYALYISLQGVGNVHWSFSTASSPFKIICPSQITLKYTKLLRKFKMVSSLFKIYQILTCFVM